MKKSRKSQNGSKRKISIGRPIQRVNKHSKLGLFFLDIPKLSHFYSRFFFFFLHKLSVISEHHSGGILKMLDDI